MHLKGLSRVCGVHDQSVSRWIKAQVQSLPTPKNTLLPTQADAVLEFDEALSFVFKEVNKRRLWTVMCCCPAITFDDKRQILDLLDVRGKLAVENGGKVVYVKCLIARQQLLVVTT